MISSKNLVLIVCNLVWIIFPDAGLCQQGIYTSNLQSGKIVIPRKVDGNGDHISHNLTHHHDVDTNELHYHILIENETLHLELEPHNYFMAPALIVERHKRDIRTRKTPQRNINCHYHGKVRGQNGSSVAVSACNGIAGHIQTSKGEYFVEPSKSHELTEKGHPHVVFHRSSVQDKKVHQNHPKRKKRRKHKRRAISNCGTKEPRRRTETRIEWQPQGKVIVQGGRKVRRHNNSHPRRDQQSGVSARSSLHRNHHRNQSQNPRSRENREHRQNRIHDHPKTPTNPRQDENPDQIQNLRRTPRSISSPRHVEALIVADPTMVAFHDDAETYLLTIMNMVSAFYKDPSIGNSIHIVVVKIVLLEEEGVYPELSLTENAQRNLDLFCSWQFRLNTENDKDPHHHDVAILITRRNICGNDCMTLGLANVGGMCKPRKSCSVNEDNGIMLSHTIAHELGHNFGMYHDTLKIGCFGRIGPIVHIMTPTFGADTVQVSWSNCSRKYITHFLDQGLGKCLDDAPSQMEFQYPDAPPGALYNAELQCRLQFNLTDDDVHVCSAPHEICSQLWCQVNGECVTNMRPTAPGTSCGKHKWCQNGKCVPMEDIPAPVDGKWGKWSEWNECSRTCGGGVSIQSRQCDNPPPANGGSFCIGERKRYKICNKQECPEGEPSFRAVQCSKYNDELYNGEKYTWLPYFDKYNPCKLFCTDAEDTVIANWADSVLDGTPCKIGTNNMCIAGICKNVGCDWVVDSSQTEDRCGVCGGSDKTCQIIKEEFTSPFNISDGYVAITTIPKSSRHILIEEMVKSPTFLSIGKTNSSKFYLNGERLISMSGEFIIADSDSLYEREDDKETIRIPGPIMHSITLYAIIRGGHKNDGIRYEFTLPAKNINGKMSYSWKLGEWTTCSATCGGGIQHRIPQCYQNGKFLTDEENCWATAKNERPRQTIRVCNEDPCPPHWWTGPWEACPVTCKRRKGIDPVRRRSVMCLDQNDIVLADAQCDPKEKPLDIGACGGGNIPFCKFDDFYEDSNQLS